MVWNTEVERTSPTDFVAENKGASRIGEITFDGVLDQAETPVLDKRQKRKGNTDNLRVRVEQSATPDMRIQKNASIDITEV